VPEIVLVRHAATAWSGLRYCGRSDPPLSEEGVGQAERLAADLGPTLLSDWVLVSSPSRRSLATAEAIASQAGLGSVLIDARWREADLGVAEGRTFGELATLAPDLAAALAAGALEIDWPDGETHSSLGRRVAAAWEELVQADRPAMVVTHAGPLMHAQAIAGRRTISGDDLITPAAFIRVTVGPGGRIGVPVLPSRA
jgi:ribonuclease H / adenosylcobalamin/alpha-ribazole phosphatase